MNTLNKKTESAISKLLKKWDSVKLYQLKIRKLNKLDLWWDNVSVIWVLITDKEEDYEGSQAQIGITKDGKIIWEYQSHCSCNGYEDSTGIGKELLLELSKKSYELRDIPEDWEIQIVNNIKELLENV